MSSKPSLLSATQNAAAMLVAIYQHVDRIDSAGGCGTISGIAAAHAMVKSLKGNRDRVQKLILDPLNAALKERQVSS